MDKIELQFEFEMQKAPSLAQCDDNDDDQGRNNNVRYVLCSAFAAADGKVKRAYLKCEELVNLWKERLLLCIWKQQLSGVPYTIHAY